MDEIADILRIFGPVFAIIWVITIASIIAKPQNYFNSMLLLGALLVTMLFVSCFFVMEKKVEKNFQECEKGTTQIEECML